MSHPLCYWIDALQDPEDSTIRRAAAGALGAQGAAAAQAIPALTAAAGSDPDRGVQLAAVAALGRIGAEAERVVPALMEGVRRHELGRRVRSRALAQARAGGDPEAAAAACQALADHERAQGDFQNEVGDCVRAFGAAAVPPLLEGLRAPDPDRRMLAAVKLGEVGRPARPAVAALHAALADPEIGVRHAAAYGLWVLAQHPDGGAWRDGRPTTAPSAGAAACVPSGAADHTPGQEPATHSLRYWLEALHDLSDAALRFAAAGALGARAGDADVVVPALAAVLRSDCYDGDVHRAAVEAVGRLGPAAQAAVPALLELVNYLDCTERVLCNGVEAARLLRGQAVRPAGLPKAQPADPLAHRVHLLQLHRRWQHVLTQTVWAALARIGRGAVPELLQVLDDPDPALRALAVEGLGVVDAPAAEVLPALRRALADADDLVREAARKLLQLLEAVAEEADGPSPVGAAPSEGK
jgi:HEAT repeat protein